jgi:hypothetical protein
MLDWLTHPLTMYAALGITAGFAWLWTRSLRARLEALEARTAPGADSTAEKLDAILERLEVLNRHAETGTSRQSAPPAAEPPPARLPVAASPPAADPAPAARPVMESAPPASPEPRPAPPAANGPRPEARQGTAADPALDAAAALRQKRRQVQRLAAMGLAPARIAAALNLPAAEVELLLKIEELLRLRAGAPTQKAGPAPEASAAAKARSV